MGSFEDHYEKLDAQNTAAQRAKAVAKYSRLLDILSEITQAFLARARVKPPDHFEWITWQGRRYAAWLLYRDSSDWSRDFYLLSTGLVVIKIYDNRVVPVLPRRREPEDLKKFGSEQPSLFELQQVCKSISGAWKLAGASSIVGRLGPEDPRHKQWLRDCR